MSIIIWQLTVSANEIELRKNEVDFLPCSLHKNQYRKSWWQLHGGLTMFPDKRYVGTRTLNKQTHIASLVYRWGTRAHVVYIVIFPMRVYTKACCFKCDRKVQVNRPDLVTWYYDACMHTYYFFLSIMEFLTLVFPTQYQITYSIIVMLPLLQLKLINYRNSYRI